MGTPATKAALELLVGTLDELRTQVAGPGREKAWARQLFVKADMELDALVKQYDAALERERGAVKVTLDTALNSGDGSYRP